MPELPYFGTYTDEDGFSVVLASEAKEAMLAYGEAVREACAKVLDERVEDCEDSHDSDGDERWLVYAKHARRLAAAIRRQEEGK